jgi:phage terminase large subunit
LSVLSVDVPAKLGPLLQKARYKGAYGGRGAAKSHFFAEQLVLAVYAAPLKAVCIREVQESIKDSCKALIEAKIAKLGLGGFFTVRSTEIEGPDGRLIIFRGMQSYNAENIKSLEGFDIAWVEEAQSLSDLSLRLLRPTIRKEGSEIWFSWNPRHDTDAVDKFLRGAHRPKDALVVEVNWNDNPWFPDVLRKEMEEDRAADPEMADHIWDGGYEVVSEGSYYARLIVDAEKSGRVGHFPHDPVRTVKTAWDIGVDDYTAIWFLQDDGFTATAIDFYEVSGDGAPEILSVAFPEIFVPPKDDDNFAAWSRDEALARLGRTQPFKYGDNYLPHDVRMREWGAGARSRVETLVSLGLKNISKGVPAKPPDRIQAVRRILPIMRFNLTPRVELGLKRLRRFRRKWNDSLQSYTTPEHDENSHAADAFGEYAVNCGIAPPKEPPKVKPVNTALPSLNQLVKDHMDRRRFDRDRI